VQSVGREAAKERALGRKPSGLGFWLANKLVFKRALEEAGLDKVRFAVSGGGAMKASTERTLANVGIPIVNAYGQSETGGIIACSSPGAWRPGSLGKAPEGVEVRIAPNGEILVRGDNTCKGYFKNPEATAKLYAHGGGWLATGDLGKLDGGGYLEYGGRAGRIGKLATGEYVNPEDHEKLLPGGVIGDSVTVFEDRNFVASIIILNTSAARRIASGGGELHKDPAVFNAVHARIAEANAKLDPSSRIRAFYIAERPLSPDDGGEIGSTGKLIPGAVVRAFAKQVEEMFIQGRMKRA
jgi:long-chain acyl-CoA synthetase